MAEGVALDEGALGVEGGGAEVGVVEVVISPLHLVLNNLMLNWMRGNRQVPFLSQELHTMIT